MGVTIHQECKCFILNYLRYLRKKVIIIPIVPIVKYFFLNVLTMSENTKLFSRPKVRFSQFSDQKHNNEIIEESCKDDTNLQTNGPKIKSIITLKKPIRIVNSIKSTNVCEEDLPAKNCEIKNSACSHDTAFENIQDTSLSNDNMPETMVSRILCNANSSKDKEKNDKFLQLNKNTRIQHNTSKYCRKALQQKDKENKGMILNRIISNKNKIKIRNSQHKQPTICKKLKLSTSSNDIQKIDDANSKRTGMTKSRSVPSIMKKTEKRINKIRTFNTKPTLSNVMPCYKYMNTGTTRDKVSPVKKTVLYDTTGPKIKTYVGSGIYHKQQNDIKTNDPSKKCYIMSGAVEKLAQPEYNSIMCTFNKLKETKQQKIAKDINDLPPIQKNLLNGKVKFLNTYVYIYAYIYIHVYTCVCVCVIYLRIVTCFFLTL